MKMKLPAKPSRTSPRTIAQATLSILEQIAANNSGLERTKDEKEWSLVFRLCHNALSPGCRKNHPKWHDEFKALRKEMSK